VDGEAVGYCHAIDAQLWGDRLPEALQSGTWELDVFIGSAAYRGRGIGLKALELLRSEVFSTTLAPAVCVYAPIRNEAAVRAYEKAGFRWQSLWEGDGTGPSWFMVARRP
jgi:aminoglycoside 6'-N-acetyltransferase